ncbi:hypothetical protein FV222_18375 [Methylobacterium sp. WL103]|uniref:hypothetical protein n=1 Tax=unclassified Methylobacterium TaxID=2615210 RepID=UPI0011C97A1A|nr:MULTISPECIES: hypothetical protein [unclassified Methylobacterium]TXM67417.1 hypothetical protein FV229_10100 [Methylobacterium sp. WL120]TXM75630.1 hypothetical protein FV226_02770 [Methylobacterium sp. WL12]TXM96356.1 hypothetical protein FV222_18375 [Methylobacterium sp. WL103]
MTNPSEIKNRFHASLEASEARENGFRSRLLAEGVRALQPVLGVLTLMSEVLDERDNVHGRIAGLDCAIDKEDFVTLRAVLSGTSQPEQRIVIKYGPELGGRNLISVSGIGQLYAEKLVAKTHCAASLGRSVGSDLQLDLARADDLAEVVREMVEAYFVGQAQVPVQHHAGTIEGHARYAVQ